MFTPKLHCNRDRIDIPFSPPCSLVALIMKRPMVDVAQRNRPFVADLLSERLGLREPYMVGLGRVTAAYQAGLRSNEAQMIAVAGPGRLFESRALRRPLLRR